MGGTQSLRVALLLGAVAIGLTGCGGDDENKAGVAERSSTSKVLGTTAASQPKQSKDGTSSGKSGRSAGGGTETAGATSDERAAAESGGSKSGGSHSGGSKRSKRSKRSKDKQPSSQGGGSAPSGGGGGSTSGAPKHVTVTIKNYEFSPQHVVVAKGGTVAWTNKDTAINHTATKTSGPSYAPDSPNIGWGGGYYEDFFYEPGEIVYICKYHPRMKGYITVR